MEGISDVVCLPEEIILEIVVWLPVKSLLKFRQVCKSWRSLIESSTFIDTHLSRTIQSNKQNDTHLFLLQVRGEKEKKRRLYSLHWDNPALGEYSKFLVNPLTEAVYNHSEIGLDCDLYDQVVGTINGVVCLFAWACYPHHRQLKTTILIWNPCIRKFVILPRPSVGLINDGRHVAHTTHAFGYDSSTRDYKVLRSVNFWGRGKSSCEVEIWSLARGSWKSLSAAVIPPDFEPGISSFVNGALHWIQQRPTSQEHFIVAFDMFNEVFGEIMVPKALTSNVHISRYRDDELAFFEMDRELLENYNFTCIVSVWVMKEYGVLESWTKLLTIRSSNLRINPLCFRKSGVVVLESNDGMLILLDPETKQVTDFRIDGYCSYRFMDSFVESLVLHGHPNTISY